MEDNGIHVDVSEENLHHIEEVLRAPIIKLVSHEASPDDDTRNTLLATQLLSPVSAPNENSGVAITMSGHVNIPVTGESLANHMTVLIGSMDPLINTTLSSNVTILDTSSTWSHEEIGAVIIVSLVVPFIIVSNIFVILSIVRFRRLRTPTNYFITSLAAVDIFVALATPFGIVVEVFQFSDAARPRDALLCLLPNRVLMMACGVSVLTLAAIAYDRHTALVSPLEYVNIMTSRKVAIIISLSWIYSVVIVWLPLMLGWYSVPSNDAPCSANLIHGKAPVLFLSAIFVPSCIAILVCYFRIFLVARHHVKAIAALEFAVHRRLQVKYMLKDTKYAKTLALVIGAFLALWLPYLICIFIKTVGSMKFDIWVQTFLILLAVFNSGINPWIYAFKNTELRTAFKRLYKELCRDKFCKLAGRSSRMSSTPRLSLTDSRMISVIPEVTLDTSGEKLRTCLDFLDEYETTYASRQSRLYSQSYIEEIAPQPLRVCLQQARKQAASCSNLDDVRDEQSGRKGSLTHSRSFSMDLALARELVESTSDDVFAVGDSPEYCETVNEVDMLRNTRTSSTWTLSTNATTTLKLQARSSLPSYLQQPTTLPRPATSAQPHSRQRPPTLTSRNYSTASAQSSISHTTVSPTVHNHTSPTSIQLHPSSISLQQHTSSQVLPHISVTSLQPHISSTLEHKHTPPTSLQHTTSAPLQQQNYNLSCNVTSNTTWSDVSCRPDRYSCDNLSYPPVENVHGLVGYTHNPDARTPNSRILSHTQSCPVVKPVASYYFLLPICETLALDVITRAARIEQCVHLATHAACDSRILMQ